MSRISKFVLLMVVGLLIPSLGKAESYSPGAGSQARGAVEDFLSTANSGKGGSAKDAELAKRLDNLKKFVTKWQPEFRKGLDEMTQARDERDNQAKFAPIPSLAEQQLVARDKEQQERANAAVKALNPAPAVGTNMAAALAQSEEACKSASLGQAETIGKMLTSKPIMDSKAQLEAATKLTPEQEAAELQSLIKLQEATLAQLDAEKKSRFERENSKNDAPRNKIDFDKEKAWMSQKTKQFQGEKDDLQRKFVQDFFGLMAKIRTRGKNQADVAAAGSQAFNTFFQYLQPTCDAYKAGMAENVKTCKNKRRALGAVSTNGQGSGLWGRIYQGARRARIVMAEIFEAKDDIGDADDFECRDNTQQIDNDLCSSGMVALQGLTQQTTYENLAAAISSVAGNLGTALQAASRTAATGLNECNQVVLAEKEAKKVQSKVGATGSNSPEGAPRTASGQNRPQVGPWSAAGNNAGMRGGFPGHTTR